MKFMCTQSIMKTNMILKTHYSSMSTDIHTTHPQQPPLKKGLKTKLSTLKKTPFYAINHWLQTKILNPLTPARTPANVRVS